VTVVDLVIIAVLILATVGGFLRGFIMMVAGTVGAIVALAIAKLEYGDVRQMLAGTAGHSPWLTVIAYLLVAVVVWTAIILVARKVRFVARLLFLGWLDRLGGAVFGFLQALILIELLLYFGRNLHNKALHHAVKHSLLGPAFAQAFPYISHWFPHIPK
jgi:membrane protein required for colicin V production